MNQECLEKAMPICRPQPLDQPAVWDGQALGRKHGAAWTSLFCNELGDLGAPWASLPGSMSWCTLVNNRSLGFRGSGKKLLWRVIEKMSRWILSAQGSNPGVSTTLLPVKVPEGHLPLPLLPSGGCSCVLQLATQDPPTSVTLNLLLFSPLLSVFLAKIFICIWLGLPAETREGGPKSWRCSHRVPNLNLLYVIQHLFRKIDLLTLFVNWVQLFFRKIDSF